MFKPNMFLITLCNEDTTPLVVTTEENIIPYIKKDLENWVNIDSITNIKVERSEDDTSHRIVTVGVDCEYTIDDEYYLVQPIDVVE